MKDIYLIRHGHYEQSSDNITHLGRKQMKGIAARLQNAEIYDPMIISSPETRALQSAQSLANYLNLEDKYIRIWDAVKEGYYDGKHRKKEEHKAQIEKAYQHLIHIKGEQPIALITHKNTGVSLLNRIIRGHKFSRQVERPFINMGSAIHISPETKNAKFF